MEINSLLITDDHALLIDGIVSTLKEKHSISHIVTCYSPLEAIKQVEKRAFDLYILDLGFRSESNMDKRCLDYMRKISQIDSQAKIIVYTMREDFATISLLNGLKHIKGIVLKGPEKEYLQKAVEVVLLGGKYLCPRFEAIHKKNEAYRNRLKKRKLVNGVPTEKELAIIRMIAVGKTSEEIAENLGHTVSTIESYRRDLKVKFNVSNMIELTLLAILLNYVSLDDVASDMLEQL